MLATRAEIIFMSRHDCNYLQEVTCKKTDPYLALNPSSFTEALCPQTSRNSKTLREFGKGGLKIAGFGTIFMLLLLEFDDNYSNDFQWRLTMKMLKGALPMQRPFRGKINRDEDYVIYAKSSPFSKRSTKN